MRRLRILALAAALAAANCLPDRRAARRSNLRPKAMEAAQPCSRSCSPTVLPRSTRRRWRRPGPASKTLLRTQKPDIDPATLADLRREFERIRLARLSEVVKDPVRRSTRAISPPTTCACWPPSTAPRPAPRCCRRCPKSCPRRSPAVLPRMQPMTGGDAGLVPQAPARARPAQLTADLPCRKRRRATAAASHLAAPCGSDRFDTSSSDEARRAT